MKVRVCDHRIGNLGGRKTKKKTPKCKKKQYFI